MEVRALSALGRPRRRRALGRGGSAVVTAATGIRGKRIWMGKAELEKLQQSPSPADKPREQRVRRAGGGRKRLTERDPTLKQDLDRLVEPSTRGDPESPLRWTTKSKANLAEELKAQGHQVSATIVGELLHEMGAGQGEGGGAESGSKRPVRAHQRGSEGVSEARATHGVRRHEQEGARG